MKLDALKTWAKNAGPILAKNIVGLSGIAAIVHGVAMWFEPLAWVVGGLALVAVATGITNKVIKR